MGSDHMDVEIKMRPCRSSKMLQMVTEYVIKESSHETQEPSEDLTEVKQEIPTGASNTKKEIETKDIVDVYVTQEKMVAEGNSQPYHPIPSTIVWKERTYLPRRRVSAVRNFTAGCGTNLPLNSNYLQVDASVDHRQMTEEKIYEMTEIACGTTAEAPPEPEERTVQVLLGNLEASLKNYEAEPFDINSAPKEVKSQALSEKKAPGKKPTGLDAPPTAPSSGTDSYEKLLSSIPEFAGFGKLFKSSSPVELTEAETEYAVNVVKHVFDGHIVFQYNCINTIPEQLLENDAVEQFIMVYGMDRILWILQGASTLPSQPRYTVKGRMPYKSQLTNLVSLSHLCCLLIHTSDCFWRDG